jgi:putative ABC transport system permease protein
MTTLQTVRTAIKALLINKMRSFLTALGVVIGVAAVVAMMAIGEGAKAQIQASFDAMGTNMLYVSPGSSMTGGSRGGAGSRYTLTWSDLRAIRESIPTAAHVAAQLRTNAQIMSSEQNWATGVIGTSPDYFAIRSWRAASGGLFTDQDVSSGSKVAVLGATVADMLFGPDVDPVGRNIRIRNIPFQVVGLLEKKGQSGMGQDNDDVVIVPESAFRTKIQGGLNQYVQGQIMVTAASAEALPRLETQIADLLRERHRLAPDAENDFSIRNMAEVANARQEGTKTLTMLLASIAAVSLLVGGIGVMNIMLVSVTERTREIGLRMAVGAKPHHILSQFLVEAVTLSMIGGFLGIAIGVVAAYAVGAQLGWPILFHPGVAILAVVFSALVGVGFGLYPARKASRLHPIDALRFE